MTSEVKDETLKEKADEVESVSTQESKGYIKQEIGGDMEFVPAQDLNVVVKQEVDEVDAVVSMESFNQEYNECLEAVLTPIELNGDIKKEIIYCLESAMASQQPLEDVKGQAVDIESSVAKQGQSNQSREGQVKPSGRVKKRKLPSILQRKRKAEEDVNLPPPCTRCSLVHPGSHPHTGVKCRICDETFVDEENLNIHFRNSHPTSAKKIVMPEGTVYACTNCTRTFKRRGDLIMHSRRNHGVEILFF